jgi:hypothetical protein
MVKNTIFLWTMLSVVMFFNFQSYAQTADGAYQEDALGTIGNPLRQELEADPALVESMDRFEDQVESGQQKIIKVGIILLKEENLLFSSLIQQSMAFEWWTLTGETSALKSKLLPGVQTYCKLKGSREMTRRMHRKRESATMGFRDVYYTFMVDEVIWVKSIDEIMAIKQRIQKAVLLADGHYENKRFVQALPHYNEAKTLAQEYLPNAVSYAVLERATRCESLVAKKK